MRKLDVDTIFIPKGHCEIAGRGVEYIWSIAKILFQKENTALNNKKWVNNLKQRVYNIIHKILLKLFSVVIGKLENISFYI